jgi:hypothetical protein
VAGSSIPATMSHEHATENRYNALAFFVTSETEIRAHFGILAAHTPGFWDLNVEQPDGLGVVTLVRGFQILPLPRILSLVPATAEQGSLVEVTITGQYTHFRPGQGTDTTFPDRVWLSRVWTEPLYAHRIQVVDSTTLLATFKLGSNLEPAKWDVSVSVEPTRREIILAEGFTVTERVSSVDDHAERTSDMILSNYPNPAEFSTTFTLNFEQSTDATLALFTLEGERVATMVDQRFESGTHTVNWSTAGLASGVYLCRLVTPDKIISCRVIIMR